MTDTTDRVRQPKGSPAGGEFATHAGAESNTLLPAPNDPKAQTHHEMAGMLARHTGVDPADIEHNISTGHFCGAPAGSTYDRLSARLGDDINSVVDLAYEADLEGGVRDLHLTLSYDTTSEIAAATGCTSASVGFAVHNMPINMALMRAQKRAQQQRALDRDINDPQQLKKAADIEAGSYRGSVNDIILVTVESGDHSPMVRVESFLGGTTGDSVLMALETNDDGDLEVRSIEVRTGFGRVNVTEPKSCDTILNGIERDLTVGLGESFDGKTTGFTDRLNSALGGRK